MNGITVSTLHGIDMQQAAHKVHKSAVCIIPPYHLIAPIQRIRCFQDKSFVRWPPHINLLYPFWEDMGSSFETAAGRIAQAVKGVEPFKLVLQQLQHFDHGSSCTAWLDPTHSSELVSLQAALAAAFPECSDLSSDPGRGITHFVPHLSIGQWRDKAALKQQLQVLQAQWRPLEWEVTEVAIISRQGYQDPFTVRWTIPLGSSSATAAGPGPQQVDVPYVATVAADNPWLQVSRANPTHRCRFGLGGAATGVWNFAYGANMSPQKLGVSRGLHPAASCPGVLQKYSLTFNHRGGFGNLVPAGAAGAAGADRAGVAAAAGQLGQDGVAVREDATATDGGMGGAAPGSCDAVAPVPQQDRGQTSSDPATCSRAAGGSGAAGGAAGGASSVQQQLLELGEVRGVLHQLTPAQLGALSNHEHEYWPMEVEVAPCPSFHGAATATSPTSTTGVQHHHHQQQQQQGSPQDCTSSITAVAYFSPPERTIVLGLPPMCRYLSLLQDGARHWQLGGTYTSLLQRHPCLQEGQQRGPEYYTSPDGQPLQGWPKIRTGSEGGSGRGKRGQGRGGSRGTGPAARRGQAA